MTNIVEFEAHTGDDARVPATRQSLIALTVRPSQRLNVQIARRVAAMLVDRRGKHAGRLDPALLGTNWVMERWGVSVGSGLPTDKWDDSQQTPPPQLDDDTAIVVDRIVQKRLASEMTRLAVRLYKWHDEISTLSGELKISERGVFARQERLLISLREEFHAVGINS